MKLPADALDQEPEHPFFNVSLLKLGIMSVMTLGFYEFYWMYQNWKLIQKRSPQIVSPLVRAIFGILFVYQLLKYICETLELNDSNQKRQKLPAGLLAVSWIIITLVHKLPYPWGLFSMLSFLPLIIVQSRVNELNAVAAPLHPLNCRFSWANWLWIIAGAFAGALLFSPRFRLDILKLC